MMSSEKDVHIVGVEYFIQLLGHFINLYQGIQKSKEEGIQKVRRRE